MQPFYVLLRKRTGQPFAGCPVLFGNRYNSPCCGFFQRSDISALSFGVALSKQAIARHQHFPHITTFAAEARSYPALRFEAPEPLRAWFYILRCFICSNTASWSSEHSVMQLISRLRRFSQPDSVQLLAYCFTASLSEWRRSVRSSCSLMEALLVFWLFMPVTLLSYCRSDSREAYQNACGDARQRFLPCVWARDR